jgi:hypothetical protein
VAGVAPCVRFAVKVVEMSAAGLAGVVYVVVAVGREEAVAFKLLALARYAPAAAGYHLGR